MKKFIYRLIIYIGISLTVFNTDAGAEPLWTDDEFYNQLQNLPDTPTEEAGGIETSLSRIKRIEHELTKLLIMPFIVDKVYPEQKINGDITGLLHLAWPTVSKKKLEMIAPFMQSFVMVKRRYNYVVQQLKQKIRAAQIFPTDSPIVAKDGEYASKYPESRKETGKDEYKVSYKPYKYLEYDTGALGEPVRLRDKNYESISQSTYDEIILALIQFDLAGFFAAIQKIPLSNDGTREKPNELGDGVRSRLLLATKYPGDLETIEGLIEVYVPKGWYINGDYLNPNSKPQFFLSEDRKEDLNIKSYKIQYPLANGVISHNQVQRIWTGDVRFPIEISRRDTTKPMHLRGTFTFELCKQNSRECRHVNSQNSLSLEPSVEEEDSVHSNFVRKAYWDIPKEKTKDAELTHAYYTPSTGKLTVKFKTSRPFSNVAVMAEDAHATNFINPQYKIEENSITATFDRAAPISSNTPPATPNTTENNSAFSNDTSITETETPTDLTTEPLAISATFDDRDALRKVISPEIFTPFESAPEPIEPNYMLAFLFGLLINLMPASLCVLERLLALYKEQPNPHRIFFRYALGSALGLALFGIYINHHPWYLIYGSAWLNTSAILMSISYLSTALGYMNFNLFRPFKGIIRRGLLLGITSVLFMSAFPYYLKSEVLSMAPLSSAGALSGYLLTIWLGLLSLPLLGLLFRNSYTELPLKLKFLNVPYTTFYVLGALWITWTSRDFAALAVMITASLITLCLWYIYPLALGEAISHKRAKADKIDLFMQVQKHCTLAIAIIFILTLTICEFIPIKTYHIPLLEEILPQAQRKAEEDKVVLLTFNANWQQPLATKNRLKAQNLKGYDIEVLSYTVPNESSSAVNWLKFYGKTTPPLNILFTKRHPQGLVLPNALEEINWSKAIRNFE